MDNPNVQESIHHTEPGTPDIRRVSAIFPDAVAAETCRQQLIDSGMAEDAVDILRDDAHFDAWRHKSHDVSDDTLKAALIDGGIGTAVGTGVGALGSLALVAANMTLFVASPVIAPLAMLGWFAGLGGVVGAAVGVSGKQGGFPALAGDAFRAGHVVLIASTPSTVEYERAKQIVEASLQDAPTPAS